MRLYFSLAIFLLIAWQAGCESPSTGAKDLNYYDDYDLYQAGYSYDQYNEGQTDGYYFDQETGSYEDVYQDYFFDDAEATGDCTLGKNHEPTFNGTRPCDVKIDGVDSVVELLRGGIDGVYEVSSCQNGRPLYKRTNSPTGEDRILWFSPKFRDWDITNGSSPAEDDVLMYGGTSGSEAQPQFVSEQWSVAADFKKGHVGKEQYLKLDAKFTCADGSEVLIPTVTNFGKQPLLTDEEMQAQYRAIYHRARKGDPNPDINVGLVTLFVMAGLGIVFGLPFLLARNRRARRKAAAAGGAGGAASSLLGLITGAGRSRGNKD